ncbi:MAG: BON domain-containing protein [Myxococcales bacterium]|nr:BON domain-containing protein [Myxococcales bacterium]
MKCFLYVGFFLTALGAIGCSGAAVAKTTDDGIESQAKSSYVFRTYLQGDDVKVSSEDGVVTLTGKVVDQSHKLLAENTVMALPGVARVDNKLEIPRESAADNSDAWIAAKAKTALLFHRSVSAMGTDIEVKDGAVTLSGQADSQAQKELTAEYVADVDGVKSVKNNITIAKAPMPKTLTAGERIDDASITAEVKGALFLHRSTSAVKTGVTTRDGVVTITGTAKNAAEKALVSKLTEDVHGVKSVENNMSVGTEVTGS